MFACIAGVSHGFPRGVRGQLEGSLANLSKNGCSEWRRGSHACDALQPHYSWRMMSKLPCPSSIASLLLQPIEDAIDEQGLVESSAVFSFTTSRLPRSLEQRASVRSRFPPLIAHILPQRRAAYNLKTLAGNVTTDRHHSSSPL